MRLGSRLVLALGIIPGLTIVPGCRGPAAAHHHSAEGREHEEAGEEREEDEASESEEAEEEERGEKHEKGSKSGGAEADEAGVEKISLAQAPSAVSTVIETLTRGGTVLAVERARAGSATMYECEFELGGKQASATLDETGQILEIEQALPADGLPEVAARGLKARFPGAKVLRTEALELHLYECVVEVDGRKREVWLSRLGKVERVE